MQKIINTKVYFGQNAALLRYFSISSSYLVRLFDWFEVSDVLKQQVRESGVAISQTPTPYGGVF